MTKSHNQSFFGSNCAIFVQSTSYNDPFLFLRFIKRKANGSWEKPSLKEGKIVKISLEEIVMMLHLLKREIPSWSTVHRFKNESTSISMSWKDKNSNILWVNVRTQKEIYSKMLSFAQTEIFKLLLKHILKEKIKYSTASSKTENGFNPTKTGSMESKNKTTNINNQNKANFIRKGSKSTTTTTTTTEKNFNNKKATITKTLKNNLKQVKGVLKFETKRAILISFPSGDETWIPKSTIKSRYDSTNKIEVQVFFVDAWVLEKNQIAA